MSLILSTRVCRSPRSFRQWKRFESGQCSSEQKRTRSRHVWNQRRILPRPGNLWVTLDAIPGPKFTGALADRASSGVVSIPVSSFFHSQFSFHAYRGLRCAHDRPFPAALVFPVRPVWAERTVKQALRPPVKGSVVSQNAENCSAGRMRSAQQARLLPTDSAEDPYF